MLGGEEGQGAWQFAGFDGKVVGGVYGGGCWGRGGGGVGL